MALWCSKARTMRKKPQKMRLKKGQSTGNRITEAGVSKRPNGRDNFTKRDPPRREAS